MRKFILSSFLIIVMVGVSLAQNDQSQKGATYRDGTCKPKYSLCPKNLLYHETNTNFSYLTYNSINWEHTLVCKPTFMLAFRLGGIYYNFVKLRLAGAPIGLNFILGGGKWLWDVGFGGTYLYVYRNYQDSIGHYNDNVHVVGVNLHVGIRYEIEESFFFKAEVDPMYVVLGKDQIPLMKSAFQPMIGIGLGYTFNH
jgi:hypothetical protein